MTEAYEQALEKHWEGICAEARDLPSIREQEAYWKRKEDEYEAYLTDLHRRQQDPEYIASYSQWLEDTNQTQLSINNDEGEVTMFRKYK